MKFIVTHKVVVDLNEWYIMDDRGLEVCTTDPIQIQKHLGEVLNDDPWEIMDLVGESLSITVDLPNKEVEKEILLAEKDVIKAQKRIKQLSRLL